MKAIQKKLLFFILLFVFVPTVIHAQENTDKPTVLVLHELWNVGVWEEQFTSNLTALLRNDPDISLDISYEFLGLGLVPEGEEPSEIIAHLAYKNSVNPVDLVVSVLPTANAFLLEYGETLFPDVPKIFVLPRSDDVQTILDLPQSVVIQSASRTAIQNTLNTMMDLLPETEHLYIVSGEGQTDAAYLGHAENIIADDFAYDVDIEYLTHLSYDDLLARVANLPEHSAILFLTYEVDVNDIRYTSVEIASEMGERANAPMFGFFDTLIGYGIVGGNVTSSSLYGATVAEIAHEIFDGTVSSGNIEVVGNTSYIYDWRELQRWHIPESRLPENAELRYKTLSFWEEHKTSIIISVLVIVIQTVLIVALLIVMGQRRRAEQATLKRETEFRAIFENSLDAISVSANNTIVLVNQAYVKMFGYNNAQEIIGKPVGFNVVPKEKSRIEEYSRRRALDKNIPIMYETRARTRNDMEFDIETHVSTYELNGVYFNVAILRNISERKRLATLTREAEILQTELNKEKALLSLRERVVSILSHEFRTPLAIMQTSLDLLTRYRERLTDERRQQSLQTIGEQIKALDEMIDNTLALFRSQSNYAEFTPQSMDIVQLCQDILEQVKLTDKQAHQFSFSFNVDDRNLMIDANLVKHILTNLLSNAVKYSPEKSAIQLELSQDREQIFISVRDEGIGIPYEDQAHLFEPFHRASNVGNAQGTGLGLSIVYQFVSLHGGKISVQSERDKGSRFEVVLPKHLASETPLSNYQV